MSSSSRMWPNAKRALEFAWKYWDADKDGVMEGEQHNTYDIEFFGANTDDDNFISRCSESSRDYGRRRSEIRLLPQLIAKSARKARKTSRNYGMESFISRR